MTRPKDWTPAMYAVALCAALVACGAMWALLAVSPVAAALAASWTAFTISCVVVATRNLRARLEATQQVVDAWNSSEARDELAKSPPAGTPRVHLFDQDADAAARDVLFSPTPQPASLARFGLPMTPAEADRLVANLRALPGDEPTLGELIEEVAADPDRQDELVALTGPRPVHTGTHLGQPCYECGAPATSWTEERQQDPYGDTLEERTFLCDDHYAAAMAEEAERG